MTDFLQTKNLETGVEGLFEMPDFDSFAKLTDISDMAVNWSKVKFVSAGFVGKADPYYIDIQEAVNACTINDSYLVYVLPGAYSGGVEARSGVNMHFMPGSSLEETLQSVPAIKFEGLAEKVIVTGSGAFVSNAPLSIKSSVVDFYAESVLCDFSIENSDLSVLRIESMNGTVMGKGSSKIKLFSTICDALGTEPGYTGKFIARIEEITGRVYSEAGSLIIDFQEMDGYVIMNNGELTMRNGHIRYGGDSLEVISYADGLMRLEDVHVARTSNVGVAIRYSAGNGNQLVLKNCTLISSVNSISSPSAAVVINYGSRWNIATNNVTCLVDPENVNIDII